MSTSPNDRVCAHCGGKLVVRYGVELTHERVRGAPVCKRLPEPVTRSEYEAAKAAGQEPEA